MTTKHENHFWHRRITQVTIGVALFVIIFYVLSHTMGVRIGLDAALYMYTAPAIVAGLALLAAGLTYLSLPKKIEDFLPPVVQSLLIATTAGLIHATGGLYSYFLALWLPAVIFTGVFGTRALLLVAFVPLGYGAWLFSTDTLTLPTSMTILMAGEVPLVMSYLLFSRLAGGKEDSTYTQLANQFSQVSDKAEVVITAITNGVIALDKQGVIELINPAAQRLIGWESRDAMKLDYKSVLKLIDKESNELTPASDPIRKVLSTNEEVRTDDFTLVTNSGKKLLVSLVASPVGQLGSGIIIVFRDITKEKTEEREQTEFISTASHEMRTPVATIEGYLGLALNPNTAQIDEKARSYITKAHEVAQHLGRLFQDLLDITKADDGRLSNNPRVVEVVSFVQDIVGGLRPQAEAKGLILVYKPVPDDGADEKSNRRINPVFYANVDNDHLREVVANLIENAIKYTKQGTVSIDIGGDEKQVLISVEDTGIGIPAEDLSHLFQKFYRVDNSDTREIGGTGLGLYLSRRLVEAMEGRVWAESERGQGSTFFASIPRIDHQEAMQLIETLQNEAAPQVGLAVGTAPFVPEPTAEPTPITPAAPAAASLGEGVFVNPPAEAIAAQLTAAPMSSTPAAAPQVAAGERQYIAPTATGDPSLATIEQNPEQYLSRAHTPDLSPTNATIPPQSPLNSTESPPNMAENPPVLPENQNQP